MTCKRHGYPNSRQPTDVTKRWELPQNDYIFCSDFVGLGRVRVTRTGPLLTVNRPAAGGNGADMAAPLLGRHPWHGLLFRCLSPWKLCNILHKVIYLLCTAHYARCTYNTEMHNVYYFPARQHPSKAGRERDTYHVQLLWSTLCMALRFQPG